MLTIILPLQQCMNSASARIAQIAFGLHERRGHVAEDMRPVATLSKLQPLEVFHVGSGQPLPGN